MKHINILCIITFFIFSVFSCNFTQEQDIERKDLNNELTSITLNSDGSINAVEEYLNKKGIEYTILNKQNYSGIYFDNMDNNDRILITTYYIKKYKSILPIIRETHYFMRLIIDENNKICAL
jgi:uncharacterized lipoprotein NlpE involved in copper resistance